MGNGSTVTYFFFGDGEKEVGLWNAKFAVKMEILKFLDYCTKYTTLFPMGRARSGGSDPLWLNIETFAKRLPGHEVDKLRIDGLNALIDNILETAKDYRDKLEWIYRPTIEPEDYYWANEEYCRREDEVREMKQIFKTYSEDVWEFI